MLRAMDFINDQSCRHLNRLQSLVEAPEFVKKSSVDQEAVKGLKAHQFADPFNREFPIDEPGHVYLSHAYMKSANIQSSEIEARIEKAAKIFGIEAELAKLDEAFNEPKQASADEPAFAISFEKSGSVQNFYPLNSQEQVIQACTNMSRDSHNIPLPLYVDGCTNIVKAAKTLGLPLSQVPRAIREYGEERLTDIEHVKFAALQRHSLTKDEVYLELAKSAAEDDGRDMDQYADLWFQADIQNGVKYAKTATGEFEDPYRIFRSGVTKEAADRYLDGFCLVADVAVPVRELAGLDEAVIVKNFPAKSASAITEIIKQARHGSGAEVDMNIGQLDPDTQKALLAQLL